MDTVRSGQTTVDVVIDNHNYARYLTAAVDSALAQTHPVRVLVVDDGSTDDSLERLAAYGDRIEVLRKPNGGQASALNAGFARCRGEVVVVLDADDVLLPDAVEQAVAAFEADARVTKVQARMEVIDAHGRPTGALKPPAHLPLPRGDLRHAEVAYPFDLVWLPMSANAYRREALLRILPIPEEEYVRCADWYLNHLTPLLGRVVSLDTIGAQYRVHGANGYEPQGTALDLRHVRDNVGFAEATTRAITALADEVGCPRPRRVLSLADLGNRLISLRLDPQRHPLPGDRVATLLADAALALSRRRDVRPVMRVLFAGWFAAFALAPRAIARRLAEVFLFHERRALVNPVLRRLHATPAPAPGPAAEAPARA